MLEEKHLKSIDKMVKSLSDLEGMNKSYCLGIVQECLYSFDRAIIYKKPPESRQEHDIITACSEAIEYFQRLSIRVTLEGVAKKIKKNKWHTRNLMVKHGLYNPHDKTFVNLYKDFILSNKEPDWENGFYGD